MKRLLFVLITLAIVQTGFAQRNWKLYTNTTHMRDIVYFDNHLMIATWGGVLSFNTQTSTFTKTMTIADGLKGNDITNLYKYSDDELMIAIRNTSIDRIVNGNLGISITEDLGLSNLRVSSIKSHGNYILVGTENGLALFQKDERVPFPLFIDNYNDAKGIPLQAVNSVAMDDSLYFYIGANTGLFRVHYTDLDSLALTRKWENHTSKINQTINDIDIKDDIIAFALNRKVVYFNRQDFEDNTLWTVVDIEDNAEKVKLSPNGESIFTVLGTWDAPKLNFNTQNDSLSVAIIDIQGDDDILFLKSGRDARGRDRLFKKPVTNIYFHDNRLYLTTWGNGFYHYVSNNFDGIEDKDNWLNYVPASIHTNNVTSIAADENGSVWFANGIHDRYQSGPVSETATGVSSFMVSQNSWMHHNFGDTPLISNNITAIGVDPTGKKWFGTWWTDALNRWTFGLSIIDNEQNPHQWFTIPVNTQTGVGSSSIADIHRYNDLMYVAAFDRGVSVFDKDRNLLTYFQLPNDLSAVNKIERIYKIDGYTFFGCLRRGILIRRGDALPSGMTPASDYTMTPLTTGTVAQIDSWTDGYITQVWFAMDNGLFMCEIRNDNFTWYQYDIMPKRRVWLGNAWSGNDDSRSQLYYGDEERLFGAVSTNPSALKIDTSGRVWIGSNSQGLAMFDIQKDRFYSYKTSNSPIFSDNITTIEYQSTTGILYLATPQGVMTTDITVVKDPENPEHRELGKVLVGPNPFRPDIHPKLVIKKANNTYLPIKNNECHIFDMSGQLITTIYENSLSEFEWNGTNSHGNKCSSGVYFYMITTEIGESVRGRIVLIR